MTLVWAAVLAGTAVVLWSAPGRLRGSPRHGRRDARAWLRARIGGSGRRSPPAALPEMLELLAAALAAGVPLARALETLAQVADREVREALDLVRGPLRLGAPEGEAWGHVSRAPGWEQIAPDLAVAADSGSSVVELLVLHAAELRREMLGTATRRARAVGVKAVLPLMVCFLPAFVLVGVVPIIVGLVSSLFGS